MLVLFINTRNLFTSNHIQIIDFWFEIVQRQYEFVPVFLFWYWFHDDKRIPFSPPTFLLVFKSPRIHSPLCSRLKHSNPLLLSSHHLSPISLTSLFLALLCHFISLSSIPLSIHITQSFSWLLYIFHFHTVRKQVNQSQGLSATVSFWKKTDIIHLCAILTNMKYNVMASWN